MNLLQNFIESNRLILKNLLLFGIINLTTFSVFSQKKYNYLVDDWSIGLKIGSNHFSGDLSSNYLFFPSVNADFRNGITIGGFVSKRISNSFTAIVDSDFTELHDTGSNYYKQYFNSEIAQINLTIDADLFYLFFNASSRIKIKPYIGFGSTFYHSSVYERNTHQLIRDTSYDSAIGQSSLNNNKKDMAFNIPLGLKVTQSLTNAIEIGIDFRVNNTLTDKLDGTVGGDNSSIHQGGLSLDMIPESSWYDGWGYLGFSLSYKIPPAHKNYIKSSRYL